MKYRRIPRPVIIIPAVLCICFAAYVVLNFIFSPYWDSVYAPMGYFSLASMKRADPPDTFFTKQQACEDIDYLVKYLGRVHPDYVDGVPDEMSELINRTKDSFGDTVNSYEIWHAACEITAAVGDPETVVMPSFEQHYLVDYINKINNAYIPVSVNGKTIGDILNDNSRYFSYIGDEHGNSILIAFLQSQEGFKFLNIYNEKINITYTSPNGSTETVTYSDSDFFTYDEAVNMIEISSENAYTSLIDKNNNYGLIKINSCDYDSDYKKFVYEFFGEVDSNSINNVIIDLSDVSSGNSQVADEIIMYLSVDSINVPGGVQRMGPYLMTWEGESRKIDHYDDLLYDGNVYIIISEKTASSGVMAAELFIDNGLAMSVGAPCGTLPDCCGDVAVFQTPNAALSFQISTKRFERINKSKSGLPLEPDILCEDGEALDKVMELITQ